MEPLIAKHSAIMDLYDPQKKLPLVVDEWGVWLAPLPGSNPGFLVQHNSLRDAIVAALNLDIFARHADRVRMANIAQMVNVLQSRIMTDHGRMVLTPTYHVFRMYVPFQDATFIPVQADGGTYVTRRGRSGRRWSIWTPSTPSEFTRLLATRRCGRCTEKYSPPHGSIHSTASMHRMPFSRCSLTPSPGPTGRFWSCLPNRYQWSCCAGSRNV
jgi:Alpha-L-arabinofuranosidase C-terminal domain